MTNMKKMTAMIMALAMTGTALGSMSAFAAEDEGTETPAVTPSPSLNYTFDENGENGDLSYSGDATPTIDGETFETAKNNTEIINISVEWEDMNFKYDFGKYDFETVTKTYPYSPYEEYDVIEAKIKNVPGWKVSGGDYATRYEAMRSIVVKSLSTVEMNVTLSLEKSNDSCYKNVEVFFADQTGFRKSEGSVTFNLKPSWSINSNGDVNTLSYSADYTCVHVKNAPSEELIDVENPPTLFTYTITISRA